MHLAQTALLAIALAAPISACSSGSGNPSSGSSTPVGSGTITGGGAESGALAVAWVVSSGSPDYTYSFGSGSYDGATFVVSFSGAPPAEAINSYGIGVGIVVLLAPGTNVPATGTFDFESIETSIVGLSAQYAIIWKDAANEGLDWSAPFPAGYSCGRCVPAAAGGVFDSFELTDCGMLEIDASGSAAICNWT